MNRERPVYTIDEFEREAAYLETIVWEALAIESGMKVLFCGYGEAGAEVARAMSAGADVTVIEHRDTAINRFAKLGAKLMRGSTSVIPAKENAFDLAVAFHYLHEIDPFFHAQVTSELSRVARRVAVVEPAPPADPLGKRIALLYSQAKRELGQFEYYQPIEYWKKLMQAVKADVSQHVFAFAKVPPHEYLMDTIDLLLKTIEVEDAPQSYIDELRQIARRSDAQLLPPPRFVLVGAALGELLEPQFSERPKPRPPITKATIAEAIAQQKALHQPAEPQPSQRQAVTERSVTEDAGYEFPPVEPPSAPAAPAFSPAPVQPPKPAADPAPGFVPGLPFGAPRPPEPQPAQSPQPTPFGAPFAMPTPDPFGAPPQGIPPSSTWQWEPPEGGDDETPFGPPPNV